MLGQIFGNIPVVVKNLLIINGLFFLATITLGDNVFRLFSLHQFQSPDFMPHQLVTHMFMHGSFEHLLMNMFTLWMFGRFLEDKWTIKKIPCILHDYRPWCSSLIYWIYTVPDL